MTSPEDDGLEEALRRALSRAAGEVELLGDGLDKIRARIGDRPPRPWLFSVLVGLAERVWHRSWRGHWAWQLRLPRRGAHRRHGSRRSSFPAWGVGWLRLVTVLAGVAVLAGIALGVQPLRHAILQASSSLSGGSPRSSAGTEGNGTRTDGGASTPSPGGTSPSVGQTGQASTIASGHSSSTVPQHPTAGAGCLTSPLPAPTGAKPSQATVTPGASGTAPATKTPGATGTAPASEVPSPATSGSSATAQPVYTNSNAPTCPVSPSTTRSPSPTPTSASSSPVPTPSDQSPTQASSPTWSDPTPTPTPTPTESLSAADPPSSSPSDPRSSDPTSRSGQQRQDRHHQDSHRWHPWRH
jgi:hypothetical protein